MTDEIRYATGLIINASIVACHFNSKLIWDNFALTTLQNTHILFTNI